MKVRQALMVLAMLLAVVAFNGTHAEADILSSLQAYWPLDSATGGNDQVGSIHLTAAGGAALDTISPLVGTAAGQTVESGTVRGGWVSALAHGSTFGVTNEVTISSWYRLDEMGSSGEKSSFRYLHNEPPSANAGLEQFVGWYSPDGPNNYHHRAVGDGGAQTSSPFGLATDAASWYHVVQRVDSSGNAEFWHEKETSTDHSGVDHSFTLPGYSMLDTANMVNGQVLTAYYEGKGGDGQVSSDEVAIWNRALTDAEIETLFDAGKLGTAITSIPEPSSLLLLLVGAVALLPSRRRRQG